MLKTLEIGSVGCCAFGHEFRSTLAT